MYCHQPPDWQWFARPGVAGYNLREHYPLPMNNPLPDDEEPVEPKREGIRVELPFISFRFGGGSLGATQMTMSYDDAYEDARRRVRARLGFYRHLATYAAGTAAIMFFDLVTGDGLSGFTIWLSGIWGAVLVWHMFNVFIFPAVWSRETEEKMIEDEMRKSGR